MSDCNPAKAPPPGSFKSRIPTKKEYEAARQGLFPAMVGIHLYVATIFR